MQCCQPVEPHVISLCGRNGGLLQSPVWQPVIPWLSLPENIRLGDNLGRFRFWLKHMKEIFSFSGFANDLLARCIFISLELIWLFLSSKVSHIDCYWNKYIDDFHVFNFLDGIVALFAATPGRREVLLCRDFTCVSDTVTSSAISLFYIISSFFTIKINNYLQFKVCRL